MLGCAASVAKTVNDRRENRAAVNVWRASSSDVLAMGLGLLLGISAEAPDGVIELSGGSVAAGIGFSWGSGQG